MLTWMRRHTCPLSESLPLSPVLSPTARIQLVPQSILRLGHSRAQYPGRHFCSVGNKGQRGDRYRQSPFLHLLARGESEEVKAGAGRYRQIPAVRSEKTIWASAPTGRRRCCETTTATSQREEPQLAVLKAGAGQMQIRSDREGKLEIFRWLLDLGHAARLYTSTSGTVIQFPDAEDAGIGQRSVRPVEMVRRARPRSTGYAAGLATGVWARRAGSAALPDLGTTDRHRPGRIDRSTERSIKIPLPSRPSYAQRKGSSSERVSGASGSASRSQAGVSKTRASIAPLGP